jgi:hypothetical protein
LEFGFPESWRDAATLRVPPASTANSSYRNTYFRVTLAGADDW